MQAKPSSNPNGCLVTRQRHGRTVTISIAGRFDFHSHGDFRRMYEQDQPGEVGEYLVDLRQTDYIDSSALGMLLLLREAVGGANDAVRIINCQPAVRRILEIANFNHLFSVS